MGTLYLGDPLPQTEDIIMIGDTKYSIVEIQPGSTRDSNEVYVEEWKKK